jgi:predicted Fe-Mo cluster-binding NifX family protein
MQIALPTNDRITLSAHFGQSAGFMVFGAQDGRIVSREFRDNTMAHPQGEHAHGGHDHSVLGGILAGCSVVICGGIGMGAVAALQAAGLQVVMARGAVGLEETAAAFLAGTLPVQDGGYCGCQH